MENKRQTHPFCRIWRTCTGELSGVIWPRFRSNTSLYTLKKCNFNKSMLIIVDRENYEEPVSVHKGYPMNFRQSHIESLYLRINEYPPVIKRGWLGKPALTGDCSRKFTELNSGCSSKLSLIATIH